MPGAGLPLSCTVSLLRPGLGPAWAMDTLFPLILLGGAQQVYFFTPRLLSVTTPSFAPDLPSQFLASLFPLVGLSKLPGMFWTLCALVPKGVRDLNGIAPTGTHVCHAPVLWASDQ